jgi:hypothetical protein
MGEYIEIGISEREQKGKKEICNVEGVLDIQESSAWIPIRGFCYVKKHRSVLKYF